MHNCPRSRKPPPEGWELIGPTLDELEQKMREAEAHNCVYEQKSLWPIFKIHHQQSRYIYDMFYQRKAISKELYEYCLNEHIANYVLIAKWQQHGVRKSRLEEVNYTGRIVECGFCGCHGCNGLE